MNILAPWSLSTYISLNGFHPLYRALAGHNAPDVRIFTPKTPSLPELLRLAAYGFYKQGPFKIASPAWAGPSSRGNLFDEFSHSHGTRDLWVQSQLPGDVELHHTAPVTCGDRPFVLHCESFLPVFFPFFQQGANWDEGRVEGIRDFYRNLFENDNCLGIVSHLPETLEQLSLFFQSDVIDKKLVGMPIGLDASYVAKDIEKSSATTKFVFPNSAHQNVNSFSLRGGVSSLKLALNLLRERRDLLFYFCTRRPGDDVLAGYGIDPNELKQYEATKIVWVEHYLSAEMLNTLVAKCHFLLLPSANLHSVSIMSALGNGTIPIVTDTIGTDVYVEDMVNGLVIRGVRTEVWAKDDVLRITRDRHRRFHEIEGKITASLINKVRDILGAPEKARAIAEAGRRTILQRFDGTAFAGRLIEEIKTRGIHSLGSRARAKMPRIANNERWIEEVSPEHFMGPSGPLERVSLHNENVIQLRQQFFLLPKEFLDLSLTNEFWSPISWWAVDKYIPRMGGSVSVVRASSLSECLRLSREVIGSPREVVGSSREAVGSGRLTQRAYLALRPYRVPYLAARTAYRISRRIGIVR